MDTMAHELAYFAGLIDGEGCITIKRSGLGIKPKRYRRSPSYVFSLCLEMTDPRPIKAFCDYFGLTFNRNNSRWKKAPARWRYLFVAQSGRQKGIEILKAILPYLKAKREEADLAVEFYETCWPDHLVPGRNRKPVPQSLLDKRHDYYLRLQALKRRNWDQYKIPERPVDRSDG